jgi:hypothetical protein
MSSSPSSQWSSLPVEIQLTITQLLDDKTLRSLSEASHYSRILCLPALYSVRSYSPLPSHPHSRYSTYLQHSLSRCTHVSSKLVGHHTIIHAAPIFPGSRASPPCVPYPHTRHQHRRLLCRWHSRCHTGDLFRGTSPNTRPRPSPEDPLPPPLYRTVSTSDIHILHS